MAEERGNNERATPSAVVVDDDVAASHSLALLLAQLGWRVYEAATARDALEQIRRDPPTLVVTDSSVPDGDGVALLTRLMAERPATVRVFYSGKPPGDRVHEALAHGVAARHFTKGHDLTALLHFVRQLSAPPRARDADARAFRLVWADGRVRLLAGEWTVGRSTTAHVPVPDREMSREHAQLHVTDDVVWIEDRNSVNGTRLNGKRVTGRTALAPGDRIEMGATTFTLETVATRPAEADDDADPDTPSSLSPPGGPEYEEPTQVSTPVPRRPSQGLSLGAIQRAVDDRRAAAIATEAHAAKTEPRTVLVAVSDHVWAEQIRRAAAIHQDLRVAVTDATRAAAAITAVRQGLLLLDAEAPYRDALLSAWRAATGRGPVVLAGPTGENAGLGLARQLHVSGYVKSGKPAILVVGQLRYQLQRGDTPL